MSTYWVEEGYPGLPLRVSVSIELIEGSRFVTVHSRLHRTRSKMLPHCYSESFTVLDILSDPDFHKYLRGYR